MRKHRTSDAPRVSNGSEHSDEESGFENGEASGELSNEPNEEVSGESVSQPASDSDNDEQFEDSALHPSTANDNGDLEHLSESVKINSNERKRSLDARAGKAGDSGPLEVYRLSKKCKSEQPLNPKLDVRTVVTPIWNKSGTSNTCNDGKSSEKQEHTGSSGKRRRSRWDRQPEGDEERADSKRRKTRWAADDSQFKMLGPIQLPDFVVKLVDPASLDIEVRGLTMRLSIINNKLKGSQVHDDRPVKERSPSPPPVYDSLGIRINSRSVRYREKLVRERQDILSRLILNNPTFKPPPDYKPPKLYKKLYIPSREYPSYNFVGLIIGPRGNTQKRMEKETGARISLRGKGSVKERRGQQKLDPSDNDDLHVFVEADSQKSLDEAVGMVEQLLIPVAEGMNDHKRAQLQELGKLNGSLRNENSCKVCGEVGHMQYACPKQHLNFNTNASCDRCGDNHPSASCPHIAPPALTSNITSHCPIYLTDFRGGLTFSTPPISSSMALGTSPSYGSYSHPGLGSTPTTDSKSNKEVDNSNLFVGQLPQTVDENRLRGLFSPFGRLIEAKVIKDHGSGSSKGYGFVKYGTPINAATAIAHMNGYKIEGKKLKVTVAGGQPAAESSSNGLHPKYPGAVTFQQTPSPVAWPGAESSSNGLHPKYPGAVTFQQTPSPVAWPGAESSSNGLNPKYPGSLIFQEPSSPVAWLGAESSSSSLNPKYPGTVTFQKTPSPVSWPGPPGSMLPEPQSSYTKSEGLGLPPLSIFPGHIGSSSKQFSSPYVSGYQIPISSPSDLAWFPGNPDYPISQFQSFFSTPPSVLSPQHYLTHTVGSRLTPLS